MKKIILISPGPVDGYPPVQHQARLLVQAGYGVELISTPLPGVGEIAFSCPNVTIRSIALRTGRGVASIFRTTDFVHMIAGVRRFCGQALVAEIAYDPIGMFYSDLVPFRPKLRIAHFHETLVHFDQLRVEKRLRGAIRGFQKIIVADAERGEILQKQLKLSELPMVVPNYPMADPERKLFEDVSDIRDGFEVIYCGSIGLNQKLDFVIASVAHWPPSAFLTIIGNDKTTIAQALKNDAEARGVKDRVRFEGWVDYSQLEMRLRQADLGICLLASGFEQLRTALGASNKRYQYMQAGLPQIGDMNPGVPQFLEGQKIGRVLHSYSEEELARIVAEYEDDPDKCREEGARARELHLTKYNYQMVFAPMLDWLNEQRMTMQ